MIDRFTSFAAVTIHDLYFIESQSLKLLDGLYAIIINMSVTDDRHSKSICQTISSNCILDFILT